MENDRTNEVTIVDIKMPFWSMVVFMVKAAVASIPAVFIVSGIVALAMFGMTVLAGLFGGWPHP
jgi:hypothetical protein